MLETFTPAILTFISALGAFITLSASQLIIADEGEWHLGSIPYEFSHKNFHGALLSGGLLGFMFLYLLPQIYYGITITHWLPIAIISLISSQTIIDLKYFELADEWTFLIGLFALLWRTLNGGLTFTHVSIALALFLFFFIGWFFVDFPGFGDVKLVLAAGVLVSTWGGAYSFIFITSLLGSIGTLLSCVLDKKPFDEWMSTKFAFGPYLGIGILMAMIGLI